MKKRDRPLVGDSPARIRVPMVGTVSLGGVVAVANGRCGASPGIKSGAGSVVGLGEEGWKPAGGAGGGGNDPSAGCCLVERSARSSRRRKAATRGPSRALKRPVCLTGRQPLLALRQRQATLRSEPRASLRQGPQPPQAAPGDQLAGPPAHPQDRRILQRPAVSGGHQGGSPARALAVDHSLLVAEPPPHQVRPLGVGPPSLMRLSLRRVHAGEDRQRTFDRQRPGKLREGEPASQLAMADRRVVKLRPVPQEPCRRREEPARAQGALRPGCPRGRSERRSNRCDCVLRGDRWESKAQSFRSDPGRLFGEQGSILCSRSRIRGTGILQVSRHETLEKPETASIVARTTERMEGFGGGFGPTRPRSLAPS